MTDTDSLDIEFLRTCYSANIRGVSQGLFRSPPPPCVQCDDKQLLVCCKPNHPRFVVGGNKNSGCKDFNNFVQNKKKEG